jgi:HTH-type transcriptional regulator, cell division transcriptional repressor
MGHLARNLRLLRRRSGLTQEQLADRTGLHRIEIGYLEGSHRLPRLDTVVRICHALEVTPNDLLDGIDWNEGQADHLKKT